MQRDHVTSQAALGGGAARSLHRGRDAPEHVATSRPAPRTPHPLPTQPCEQDTKEQRLLI